MDFGTLKSRLLALIGRAPADVVYELVTADINNTMRLRVMESTTTLTEAASISLPSDFLEAVAVYRDTDPRYALRPVSQHQLDRAHQTSGIPATYTIVDGAMLLNPAPNGSENIELRYYAKLSDLSADTDENDVLTTYPSIYVYGALAHHGALVRDPQVATWFAAYEKAKAQARADDNKARFGGAPVRPTVTHAP